MLMNTSEYLSVVENNRRIIFRKCIRQVHLMADKGYKVFIVEGAVRKPQNRELFFPVLFDNIGLN